MYTSYQVVSEDDLYPAEVRQQAALVASKVGNSSILVCWTIWMFRCTTTLAPTKTPCNMLWVLLLSSTSPTLVASECIV